MDKRPSQERLPPQFKHLAVRMVNQLSRGDPAKNSVTYPVACQRSEAQHSTPGSVQEVSILRVMPDTGMTYCIIPTLDPRSIVGHYESVSAPIFDPQVVLDVATERMDDEPYSVFLWNDPVTLMEVVVRVLQKIFGYDAEKAELLMITAHLEGKAVVWTGGRDRARRYSLQLGSYGLQATVAKVG